MKINGEEKTVLTAFFNNEENATQFIEQIREPQLNHQETMQAMEAIGLKKLIDNTTIVAP